MSNHRPEWIQGEEERAPFNKGLQGMEVPPPTPVEAPMSSLSDPPADTPGATPPTDYDG
jgi:hypothetical protein